MKCYVNRHYANEPRHYINTTTVIPQPQFQKPHVLTYSEVHFTLLKSFSISMQDSRSVIINSTSLSNSARLLMAMVVVGIESWENAVKHASIDSWISRFIVFMMAECSLMHFSCFVVDDEANIGFTRTIKQTTNFINVSISSYVWCLVLGRFSLETRMFYRVYIID